MSSFRPHLVQSGRSPLIGGSSSTRAVEAIWPKETVSENQ